MQSGDEASSSYMQGWSDITSLAGWSAAPYKNGKQGWLQGFWIWGWGKIYKGCFYLLISPDCLIYLFVLLLLFSRKVPHENETICLNGVRTNRVVPAPGSVTEKVVFAPGTDSDQSSLPTLSKNKQVSAHNNDSG